MSEKPLLRIDGVSAHYGSVRAVDDVSFDILENEFFALLGPSGCGKTTLLRSIAGFETPSSGTIELDGENLLDRPAHKRPVNLMFQSYALFGHMSVEKNIAYGLEAEGLGKAETRERVEEAMETIGLTQWAKRRPTQLSGGQRQRVALARALVKRPRLLLLDEPLSALDRRVRAEMQQELKRLQHEVGLTFVVVTHDQEEAMSMADRVAVLNAGALEQLDSPAGLYSRPKTRFVAEFIGTSNLLPAITTAEGVVVDGLGPASASHELPVGERVTVVVRPENTLIDATGLSGTSGEVVDSSFLGGSVTLRIRVEGVDAELLATVRSTEMPQRGDRVGVHLDEDQLVLLTDD